MKQRVLVMNGQRIVEANENGDWVRQKVDKANGIKPGIYNLYASKAADKGKKHDGMIVHTDEKSVYQKSGSQVVLHSSDDFDIVPTIGEAKSIGYDASGKALVTQIVATLSRGKSR